MRLYPPSSRGLVIGGKNTHIADTRFGGHVSWHGITGSDITLNQSNESPVTGLIVNSVMESERPIIFGYPINEASRLEVRAYQGNRSDDFSLSRIDMAYPGRCPNGSIDMSFIAKKC